MCPIGPGPDRPEGEEATSTDAAFTALLEDSAEELYESAPCGYLSTLMDGTIAKINTTLLTWLGRSRDEVVGRMRFMDLLTAGGRIYHDTHFAPSSICRAASAASPWTSERPTAAGSPRSSAP